MSAGGTNLLEHQHRLVIRSQNLTRSAAAWKKLGLGLAMPLAYVPGRANSNSLLRRHISSANFGRSLNWNPREPAVVLPPFRFLM
jgi:hypothetical protein